MRPILRIFFLLLIAASAHAQLPPMYFDASIPTVGGLTITTVASGATSTGGGCVFMPSGWWIGGGGVGSYTHTFSRPVYRIMIPDWALNGGTLATAEYKQFFINGSPYPISPAQMYNNVTACPSTGPNCYVSGGFVYGPLGTGGDYGGDTVLIESCDPILSIEMYCGRCTSGDVYTMLIDTAKPKSCQKAIANTPCVIDTLFLSYVGDSTGATYKWTGPGGFTSTNQYSYIYPSSMTDTGLYIAYRTKLGVTDTDSVYVNVTHCSNVFSNSPCEGDTLWMYVTGDSAGVSYKWIGPKGTVISTKHHPFIFPASITDSGTYYAIRSVGTVSDTDILHVIVHPRLNLSVTDNAPMCDNSPDTLRLQSFPTLPGMTYAWTGPNTFTSTVQAPIIDNFHTPDTGFYQLIAADQYGCKDTARVFAGLVPAPKSPVISISPMAFCKNDPLPLWSLNTTPLGITTDTIVWSSTYLSLTGKITGPGTVKTQTYVTTSETMSAYTINYFGCKSPVINESIHMIAHPPKPTVTGGTDYCQYIGPFVPVSVTLVHINAKTHWWTVPKGTSPYDTIPTPDLTTPGATTYYVSQNDSTCESDSTLVTINVHPKPAPPTIKSDSICQFWPAGPMTATASISGDVIRWFVAPDTIGNLTAPVPVTLVPGLYQFFANELSSFGCLSDKGVGTMYVKPKPAPPTPFDTTYCQFFKAPPLTADSVYGGYLKWYIMGTLLPHAPVPSNVLPGDSTWYVSEVIDGCESDSLPSKVTTIYKPKFSIEASSPFVCQFDSVRFAYKGPSLFDPAYSWGIPPNALFAHVSDGGATTATDSFIYVRFDSVTANNYITLHVTDDHGFCAGDTSFRIKIVAQPYAKAAAHGDICQGDTVSLALGVRSESASKFIWKVDDVLMDKTNALNILAHNSNSGGPFSISWNDTGRHVIQVISTTDEGCTSMPTEDTVSVHSSPDAAFTYLTKNGTLCLEDSIQFTARATDYNYSYAWAPEHFFSNVNKRQIYGRVELSQSTVTLMVTDPFGCSASTSQTLNPGSCCTVGFPSAFLPNGGVKNNVFRPVYQGYHRFSIFRIANRWGQTVFESTNNGMVWDGTFNGVPQDAGVYFYYLKYDCGGKSLEQTGDVTLIR